MRDSDPKSTFQGLPLTAEQDAEVKHYIKVRTRRGLPWDTPELSAMLKDMLLPPGDGNSDVGSPEACFPVAPYVGDREVFRVSSVCMISTLERVPSAP
ncbi:hypothetical protein [Burkholderia sp. HI2714]|uniref:hypothetical protein n=1 Tax=Burkholderia sp. HI2714 TaxID=2015359 RepID=UPI000B7A822D|nr:hypothetical protein [Burkholderia sp. HI2714]